MDGRLIQNNKRRHVSVEKVNPKKESKKVASLESLQIDDLTFATAGEKSNLIPVFYHPSPQLELTDFNTQGLTSSENFLSVNYDTKSVAYTEVSSFEIPYTLNDFARTDAGMALNALFFTAILFVVSTVFSGTIKRLNSFLKKLQLRNQLKAQYRKNPGSFISLALELESLGYSWYDACSFLEPRYTNVDTLRPSHVPIPPACYHENKEESRVHDYVIIFLTLVFVSVYLALDFGWTGAIFELIVLFLALCRCKQLTDV